VARLARAAGFDLVGFARAEPLPRESLVAWLEAGHHAGLDWMAARLEDRLDVTRLLPGARTVVALACNYFHPGDSPVARYARGRDYHATLRDRVRALRRALRRAFPGVADFASVDSGPVLEKVWAVKAGLGALGKNACLLTPAYGSWVVLAVMLLDRPVDAYFEEEPGQPCGRCRLCLDACPTGAIVADGVVDSGRCLSYQTIEHHPGPVPEGLRPALAPTVFGCDDCQDVCPHNRREVVAGARFAPRPVAALTALALAGLSRAQWEALAAGTALVRAGYDGLRRNACYALGAAGELDARPLLEALAGDAAEEVREAARWALERLDRGPC
jgi:epoxyqueuosine reductase